MKILLLVHEHRFMSVELLAALMIRPPEGGKTYGFGLSGLRARCQKLREGKYLVWKFLRDQPTGRGSHSERGAVYSVGSAAIDLLVNHTGLDRPQLKASIEKNALTSFFVRHFLSIARLRVCLELACQQSGGVVRLGTWLQDGLKDRVRVDIDGEEQIIPIVPDAVFSLIVRRNDGRTALSHFALEFDMGTMSEVRIASKARGFRHYIKKGLHRRKYTYAGETQDDPQLRVVQEKWNEIATNEQEEIVAHSIRTFQVLFVTRAADPDIEKLRNGRPPDRLRQQNMVEAVRRVCDNESTTSLFLFCTEDLDYGIDRPVALFSPIWQTVNPGGGKLAILPDLD